jgi:hypothetical protein
MGLGRFGLRLCAGRTNRRTVVVLLSAEHNRHRHSERERNGRSDEGVFEQHAANPTRCPGLLPAPSQKSRAVPGAPYFF